MPKTYTRWDAESTGKARLSHSVLMSVQGRLLPSMGPKFQEKAPFLHRTLLPLEANGVRDLPEPRVCQDKARRK